MILVWASSNETCCGGRSLAALDDEDGLVCLDHVADLVLGQREEHLGGLGPSALQRAGADLAPGAALAGLEPLAVRPGDGRELDAAVQFLAGPLEAGRRPCAGGRDLLGGGQVARLAQPASIGISIRNSSARSGVVKSARWSW